MRAVARPFDFGEASSQEIGDELANFARHRFGSVCESRALCRAMRVCPLPRCGCGSLVCRLIPSTW
jgi:hypothetical protein